MVRVAEGVEQRGDSLRIVFRWKGQKIQETVAGDLSPEHVRRAIKRKEWLQSRLRLGLPIYEDDERLLGAVFEDYLSTRQVKRSSLRSEENIWKNYWSRFNDLTPQTVSKPMILKVLVERGVSPKTQKNALSVLSSVLDHAEVAPNPCSKIKIKKGQRARVQRYSIAHRSDLLQNLHGADLVYFTIFAATGMRPGEILALQWTDWDGERLDVSKNVTRRRLEPATKTDVARRVYVPQWARQTINEHVTRFKGGFILQNTFGSHHCDTEDFNEAWLRAHKKARVPYRIPYTLRHTRAAELLSQGALPALAAKELGHSIPMFLDRYSEFIEEYSNQDTSVLEGSVSPYRPQVARKSLKNMAERTGLEPEE